MEEGKNGNVAGQQAAEYPVVEKVFLPERIICPECGGMTTEGRVFCERCGGELEPMEPEEYARLQEEFGWWLKRAERADEEEAQAAGFRHSKQGKTRAKKKN